MAKKSKIGLSLLLIIIVALLIITCPVLLIVFGVNLGKPFEATKDFTETSCTVIGTLLIGTISCHCNKGPKCKSSYPCVELLVTYTNESGKPANATLFDNDHNFLHYGYIPITDNRNAIKCSTYSCEGDPDQDASAVADFVQRWGATGKTFSCYYNRVKSNEALLEKVSGIHLTLGIVLPLVFFIVGILLLVFFYHRILVRRGEKILCLGRFYEMQPNELSPPISTIESTI